MLKVSRSAQSINQLLPFMWSL